MAHVEDQWKYPDGRSRARDGTGRRWRVRYVDPDGNECSRSFERKTDADRFEKTTAADLIRGQYIDPSSGKVTLQSYAAGWLGNQTFGASSREVTERRLRLHVYPALGSRTLAQLTPSVIQAWVKGLTGSQQLLLSLVSSILNAAVDDGLIRTNPCRARSVKAPRPDQHKIVPWTAQHVAAIRGGLPAQYAAMADCGAGLGMRQGEVLGLAAGDVDFLRRVVHVRRQVAIISGKLCFGPPKGGKERDVPLPDEVGLRLSAHIAAFPPVAVTLPWQVPAGRPETADLLFTRDGAAVNRHQWNVAAWKHALKAAGIPPARDAGFHQLRHHYASSLLSGGVDVRALATYLGHSDPGFTLRVYCHLMPAAEDKVRQTIDAALRADVTATARKTGNLR